MGEGVKIKLLDLFCGAGGASMGYHRAGFEVVGVDINRQPNYPFEFHQADALTFPLDGFDVIHASPPCRSFTYSNHYLRASGKKYDDFIPFTRERLLRANVFSIIENVPQANLNNPILLCGSMFGLDVKRHRHFECNFSIPTPACRHFIWTPKFKTLDWKRRKKGALAKVVGVYGSTQYPGDFKNRCNAMQINWMKNKELVQAIPPAYTEYIGKELIGSATKGSK